MHEALKNENDTAGLTAAGLPRREPQAWPSAPKKSVRLGGRDTPSFRLRPMNAAEPQTQIDPQRHQADSEGGQDATRVEAVDPALLQDLRSEMSELKDTVATFEAFFAVSLVNKLDEIVTEKLSIVERLRRSRSRFKWLLTISLGLNVGFLLLLWPQLAGGPLGEMLRSASEAVRNLVGL